jgi:chromosome segregation ATPase
VEALCKAHNDLYEAELMYIEAKSDFEVLTERNGTIKQQLEVKEREVQELEQVSNQASKLAKKVLEKCKFMIAKANEDPELKAFHNSLPPGQTVEELDADIEQEEAKLGFMVEGNHGIIEQYERRQRDIDSLKASLAVIDEALEELGSTIEKLQSKWEPQLDKLVKRISDSFSYNMKQINCAGEVSVYKDEDFDQWAIQIQVKFRLVSFQSFILKKVNAK